MILKETARNAVGSYVIYAFYPERLEIVEVLKEPAPRDIIHLDVDRKLVKNDTEVLHSGKHRGELAAHLHYKLWGTT